MSRMLGLREVRFDQGALGHATRKPTTTLTNMDKISALNGLGATAKGAPWPEELEARLEWAKQLAAWAPGLVEQLTKGVVLEAPEPKTVKVKALTGKEKRDLLDWGEHYRHGHVPYRRDCLTCLEMMGRDRPHRRLKHPDSYCLSFDISGPFHEGRDQVVKEAKYMMLGVITVPVHQEVPLVEELRAMGVTMPGSAGSGEEGLLPEQEGEEEPHGFVEVAEEADEEIEPADAAGIAQAHERWKAYLAECSGDGALEVKNISFGVPLQDRKTSNVLEAAAQIYGRVRALNIPILRIHTDRAREFSGAAFRKWVRDRDVYQTMTAGDEPCGNARVEREIGVAKGRIRALLRNAEAPEEYWPLALRHAMEQRMRQQLLGMGIRLPELIPFGARVVAKRKLWFQRYDKWKQPMEQVVCWGPAADMSATSQGYYVRNEEGRWFRSTVVVKPDQLVPSHREFDEQNQAALADALGPQQVQEVEYEAEESSEPGGPTAPRRRIRGKQAPDGRHPVLSLCAIRERGEWFEGSGHQEVEGLRGVDQAWEVHEVAEELAVQARKHPEGAMLKLLQHRELTKLVQEEASRWMEGGICPGSSASIAMMMQAQKEIQELEGQMGKAEAQQRSETAAELEKVSQTRTVMMDEVKQNLDLWVEPFKKEVDTLTAGPVERLTAEQFAELKRKEANLEVLPMKMVATQKPNKLKGRIVACGNLAEEYAHNDVSVGGACAITVRTAIHIAANMGWSVGSIDVTAAFLQAPRRGQGKVTVCEPPRLLQRMGLVQPGEMWRVGCAIYGLAESPSDWGAYRDECMRKVRWKSGEEERWLEPTSEKHLWKVLSKKEGSTGEAELKGLICVYVDDLLAAGERAASEECFGEIKKLWKCSDEEWASQEKGMRFCGYDVWARADGGFDVGQEGYLKDVFKRRGVVGTEATPAGKIEEGDDEQWSVECLREAQAVTGELMWVANRTRPDLAYITGLMSRLLHRRPAYVVQLGEHALLAWRLQYKPWKVRCEEERHLPVTRSMSTMEVYADASFAPPHEQFRSI